MKRKVSDSEFEYGIHEVYYKENGEIEGYTQNSIVSTVHSPEGLKYELESMMKAFDLKIVDYTEKSTN
ncbi:hypothetical protein [Fluviicola taffensis]|nr:hypothetical protein [Fluviicola taffensis]